MVCHSKALLTSTYWQCKGAKTTLYDILRFSVFMGQNVQITKSFGLQNYVKTYLS